MTTECSHVPRKMAQIGDETTLLNRSAYELPSSWLGDGGSTLRDPSPLQRGYAVKGPKQPSQDIRQVHSGPIYENARQMDLTVSAASQRRNRTEEAARKLLKSFEERFVKEVRAKGNLAFTAKLHRQDIIPEDIQSKVEEAHSHESANSILLEFRSSPISRPVSPCES